MPDGLIRPGQKEQATASEKKELSRFEDKLFLWMVA